MSYILIALLAILFASSQQQTGEFNPEKAVRFLFAMCIAFVAALCLLNEI